LNYSLGLHTKIVFVICGVVIFICAGSEDEGIADIFIVGIGAIFAVGIADRFIVGIGAISAIFTVGIADKISDVFIVGIADRFIVGIADIFIVGSGAIFSIFAVVGTLTGVEIPVVGSSHTQETIL